MTFNDVKALIPNLELANSQEILLDAHFKTILKDVYFKRLLWNLPEKYKQNSFEFLHFNLPTLINNCIGTKPSSNIERIEWEETFEEKIRFLLSQEILDLHTYRATSHELRSKENRNRHNIFAFLDEANRMEMLDQPMRGILKLFRYVDKDQLNSLSAVLKIPEKQIKYPYVATSFELQEQIKKLNGVFAIINYYNLALQEFNHRISRNDAREITIKDAFIKFDTPKLKFLFEEFSEAWEQYYKYYKEEDVGFDCHRMRTKNKIRTYDSLSFILADDKEEGGGMYLAALIQDIINTQNSIMRLLYHFLQKDINYREPLEEKKFQKGIKYLREYEIINSTKLDLVSIETLAEEFTFYNLEYGNGGRREFNLALLNDEIFNMVFERKKFISYEMNFIKYHFEITRDNRLISELRRKIPQKKPQSLLIENLLKIFKGSRNKKNYIDFYRSLQSLLYIILNQESINYKFDDEILEIYNKNLEDWKFNQELGELLIGSGLKLVNYEWLLCFIELKSYKSIKEKVPTEYKADLDIEQIKLLDNFLSELNSMGDETFITKQFFSDALRRFISRYLFVSNLRPDQNISSQILYDDLWDADLFEKEKFWDTDCWMLKNFPLNLRVCNSVKILEIISDNNNGKEGNSIRPSRQNSVKDIKDIKKIMNLRRK